MNYYSIFEKLLALKYCVPQYMNFAQTLSESHQNDFFSHKFGPFSENNRPFKVLNHSLSKILELWDMEFKYGILPITKFWKTFTA